MLDEELQKRLSARKFVSMAIERSLGLPPDFENLKATLKDPVISSRLNDRIEIGNVRYTKALDYVNGQTLALPFTTIGSSIFEIGLPGALSLDEVLESVPLHEWKVSIGGVPYELQVSLKYVHLHKIS